MASSSQAPGQDSETRPPSIADGKPRWIPVMPYANLLGLGDATIGNKIGSHTQLMLDQIRGQRVLDVTSETLQNAASLTDYSSGDNHQPNQIFRVHDFANENIPNEIVHRKDINIAQAADGDPIELPAAQKKDEKNRLVPVESASVHQPESGSVYHSEIEEHSMKENEGGSNKMQQPKPKRKKLRPKVLREDKPHRAPKSDPTPPVTPKPPKPPKRKYVRKKNVPKPSDVPTSSLGESVDPENENGIKSVKENENGINAVKQNENGIKPVKENENGIKAVKRRLDINSEEPCAREEQRRASQIYACNEALNIVLPQAKRKQVQETCVSGTLSSSIVISAATSSQEQEMNDEKSLAGITCSLNTSMNQVPSEYIHPPETPTPNFYPSRKRRSMRINQKHGRNDRAERTSLSPPHPSRRERIRENLKELYLNVNGNSDRSPESRHKNQLPPNSSTAVLLRGLKRAYNFVGGNCIQGYKGSACTGDRMGYMIRTESCSNDAYFPKIYKKKRTQKGLKVTPNAALIVTPSASSNNLNSDRVVAAFERERASWLHRALFNQRQPKEDLTPDLPAQSSKLIPPGITEAWNNLSNRLKPSGLSGTQCTQLSTPEKRPGCNISYGSMSYGRQYSYVNWTTKKRTKKEDKPLVKFGPLYRNQIRLAGYDSTSSAFSSHGKYRVHITAQTSRRSPVSRISCSAEKPFQGITSPSMMVRYEDLLDSIVWKMKCLNIYGIHVTATAETHNALVPYNGGGRTLVPYARPLVIAKKQPLRPKVDLDEETTRVWNQLMEKGSTDEGVDAEKDKWWEQERRTVRGRIDSFIARMHLVQGDRRFSRWKGSVVDSVVGVFLTQNVSDHLSSSAFMALAAKYPYRSEENNNSSDAEMSSTSPAQQEVCSADSDDNLKCQKKMFSGELLYQDFFMTPEVERAADREIGNYNESLGSNSCTTVLDYSIGNHLEIHPSELEVGHQSPGSSKNTLVAVTGTISAAETEDKPTEDMVLSKSSIISSQNSSELIVQSDGQTEPISITDMEDLVSGDLHNAFNSSTSFMELLQMAESASFKEMYSSGNLLSEELYITPDQMAYSEFDKRTSIEVQQDKYKGECPSLHRLNSNCHDMHDELMGVSRASSTSYESRNSRMASIASRMNAIQNDVITVSGPSGSSSEDMSQQMLSFTSSTPDTCVQVIKHSVQPLTCSGKGVYMDNQSCSHSIYSKEISEALSCKNTPESSILEGDQRAKLQHEEIARKHAANVIRAEGHGCDARQASSGVHQSCLNLNNDTRETVEVVDEIESIKKDEDHTPSNDLASTKRRATRPKKANSVSLKEDVDWDNLRKKSCPNGTKVERSSDTMDSVDWDAVRCADVKEVSETIRDRGMNNVLAQRIKIFLNRLVQHHGSIDLEWLRDIPPESTKDFLLSITGLGLKSAECVRLLTLHQLAFPVDTNVGRICVRLGWVPLQPLPESLQLHLLELYPVLESIQKYLWPRLCKLDQQTLYELHYQMITFGKVFCTKRQPNCNACPMRAECRHFASAFTSAKKLLTGPEEKGLVRSAFPNTFETAQTPIGKQKVLPQLEGSSVSQQATVCEPIIEEPASPEPEPVEDSIREIEEDFVEDPDEIPHIKLNLEAFTQNIQDFMQSNMKGQEGEMSNALVVLTQEAASIPVPKLKNRKRLRTEHLVYELQDNHPLLEGFNQREPDDPSPYLLAIWSPGETAHSYDQTERRCNSRGPGELCDIITCFACNSVREARTQTVRGTIMIPCRTANKGSFPLNGTYFQVNEVFADHESSLHPIVVPRHWIGSLPRRTVYFGTSVPAIFKGLTTDEIMFCFWKGFVCVRGFDRETGAPRPLYARLHLAASKAKNMKAAEEAAAAAMAAAVAEEARKQKQEEATKQKQQQWRRSRNQM